MIRKYAPLVAAALILAVLAGSWAWRTTGPTPQATAPGIGGNFHLIDQTGRPVDQTLLNGKWTVVFFGYTSCPDVCPTTLQTLGAAAAGMGPERRRLQIVFITVDPQRDTPAQLKDYLSSSAFAPGVIGLTGSPAQVAQAAKAYGIYYQKQGTGDTYAVNHSSAIYLMNPQGRFDSVIASGLSPQQTRDSLLKAMRTS